MTNQPPQSKERAVVQSSEQPDYSAITVPTKPPTEYHYTERRAELLQLVEQAGHPAALNQAELAERYGVSQQQISKDLDRIAEYVSDHLGTRHVLGIDTVFRRAIRGLLEEGEYRQAARTAKEYDEWVVGRTDLDEIRAELKLLKKARGIDR